MTELSKPDQYHHLFNEGFEILAYDNKSAKIPNIMAMWEVKKTLGGTDKQS